MPGAIITVLPSSLKCRVAVYSSCRTSCHVKSYVHLMFYIFHTGCHNLVMKTTEWCLNLSLVSWLSYDSSSFLYHLKNKWGHKAPCIVFHVTLQTFHKSKKEVTVCFSCNSKYNINSILDVWFQHFHRLRHQNVL